MASPQNTDDREQNAKSEEQQSRVDLIFNEISGKRDPEKDLDILKSTLKDRFSDIRVWRTTANRDGFFQAIEALSSGGEMLVACGGDGTVAAVAAAIKQHNISLKLPIPSTSSEKEEANISEGSNPVLSNRPAILGVVPRGTANALCNALHIPMDPGRAAQMVVSGMDQGTRTIDFPSVPSAQSDQYPKSMLLLAGIGLEAETVRNTHRDLKRSIGAAAYAVAGISTIIKQKAFQTDLVLHDVSDSLMFADGNISSDELHLKGLKLRGVTVANAAPPTSVLAQGNGEVRPDDGFLEIVCVTCNHPLGMIQTMLYMLRSALLRRRESRSTIYGIRAKKVTVTCDPPQRIVIDGEEAGFTPVTLALQTGDKIDIIAPEAGVVSKEKDRRSRTLIRVWRHLRGLAMLAIAVTALHRSRKRKLLS